MEEHEQVDQNHEEVVSTGTSLQQGFFRDAYYLIVDNTSLFVGVILMASSILNIHHDKYCDGTPTSHQTCLNPSTYYEYSGLTIFLFVLGAVCFAFWYVKRNTVIIHE